MKDSIEIRSESVQDILGQVPPALIRWGTTIIILGTFLLLAGSWIFKYPDKVRSKVVITTAHPPAAILSRTTGKISSLNVKDNQIIGVGDILGIIENPADYSQMKTLILWTDTLGSSSIPVDIPFIDSNWVLGELQDEFASMVKANAEWRNFLALNYHEKKERLLVEEVKKYSLLINQLNKQLKILRSELNLSSRQFSRDSAMFRQGVIAAAEYEKAEALHLQKKYAYEEAAGSLTRTKLQMAGTEQQILDLRLQKQKEESSLQNQFTESLEKLKGAIGSWEQSYVLKSPIGGRVTFNSFWSENQTVQPGDRVMTIVPEGNQQLIGRVDLPVMSSGKVRNGQKAYIRFENFPYLEYGVVTGIVSNVSAVPQNNFYTAEIVFPDSLKTNYGNFLPFAQEMQGVAEIVTENRRVIDRILGPLRSIIKKQQALE